MIVWSCIIDCDFKFKNFYNPYNPLFFHFETQISIEQGDGNGTITCFHDEALEVLKMSEKGAQKMVKSNKIRGIAF